MSTVTTEAQAAPMNLFERYLTLWVALCIVVGTGLGHLFPTAFATVSHWEVAQVNLPIAVLIWIMIIPMLLRIDFAALAAVRQHWQGIGVAIFTNWTVRPSSTALLAWSHTIHKHQPGPSQPRCRRRRRPRRPAPLRWDARRATKRTVRGLGPQESALRMIVRRL